MIKKNTKQRVPSDSMETVIKTRLSDLSIIQPNNGGPAATPKNRKLLYRDVIIPRSLF